jgi:antitoxin VapB
LPGEEVLVKRVGNAVVLIPENDSWSVLLASLDMFEDFPEERIQPHDTEREEL